ncbi:hypothetical protein [Roseococcus sp. YIM B11640]|uniref:hypothetical protein n=1 Tax=Roseococcus sp. YIM B11640 TaxID=3133973 RepID=UPI003C7C6E92
MLRRALLPALAICGPLLLGACGGAPPPRLEGPAISYRHLTQIRLNVASIDFEEREPNPGPSDIGRTLQPTAAQAVMIMGRDRLASFGTENKARFSVTRAQILRTRNQGSGGTFASDPGERLEVQLSARLDIQDPNGRRLGFAEASAQRTQSTDSNPRDRNVVAESLLRQAMFDLNTEFEYQIRRALRPYIVEGIAAEPAGSVSREELPRS